jgi:hypothetical protein
MFAVDVEFGGGSLVGVFFGRGVVVEKGGGKLGGGGGGGGFLGRSVGDQSRTRVDGRGRRV